MTPAHEIDVRLRATVLFQLRGDPRVEIDRIGIACLDRVITLTGALDNLAKRTEIAEIVAEIPGVDAVDNRLVVQLPSDKRLPDDAIAERVRGLLAASGRVTMGRVGIRLNHAWLRLTGEVEHSAEKDAAEHCVDRLDIIRGFSNELRVEASRSEAA